MGITVSDETVQKVKDSWDIVLQIPNCTQVAGELLFRNIFRTAPGAHKMFPFGKEFDRVEDRMFKGRLFKKHAKNVVDMLDSAVQMLGPDLNELEEILVALGAKHVGYGILPEHYPIVGQALLETLATALGEQFTDDLRDCWSGVYGFITSSMLKGANQSLLRFQVEVYGKEKKSITLDEYVSSMLDGQTELYYITMDTEGNFRKMEKLATAKELQKAGVVILHIAKNKQTLLATNLQKYLGRKMVDVASDHVDTSFLKRSKKNATGSGPPTSISVYKDEGLDRREAEEFCVWFQAVVGEELVDHCTPTCDFASQAARVIAADEHQERHLEDYNQQLEAKKKHIEINPKHPLIIEINKARNDHPFIANMLAAQIYDNCLTQAGMLRDFRIMVNRINDLSLLLLQEKTKVPGKEEVVEEEVEEKPESSTEEEDEASVSGSGPDVFSVSGDSIDGAGSFDSAAFDEAESYNEFSV